MIKGLKNQFRGKFKFLLLFTLFFLIGTVYFITGYFLSDLIAKEKSITNAPAYSQTAENLIKEDKPITLILVGDIMLDRGVEYMVSKEGDGDFKFPFLKIADELQRADIVFGNLEGPISDKGVNVGSIYSFRAEPKAIEGLTFAGFDILSLANNHAFDYGRQALEDTFLRLREAGIDYIGAGFNENETNFPLIKEVNGTKIAFLAYTNLCPESWQTAKEKSGIACISEKDLDKVADNIKKAKNESDILIVSFHAGEEYITEPSRFQIEFSKMAIDSGADLVVGHHPHVVQKNENYSGKWIFYSLGNFIFDQGFSEETMQGQILKVLIKNGRIQEVIPIDIKLNNYFQPEIIK